MSRSCTVCGHPDRSTIDAALVSGGSYSGIAREHALSEDALRRHLTAHLGPATVEANRARERDINAEMERMIRRIDGVLDRAERKHDDRLLLLAVREELRALEVLAKLRGDLDERPQQTVQIALSVEWQTARTVLLQALAPHPAARRDVVAALLRIDAGSSSSSSTNHNGNHLTGGGNQNGHRG